MASKKRLKRTAQGDYILPNGEKITITEQKALRSAVVSANRKRAKYIEALPKNAKQRYLRMGIDSDFIARKKSTKLNRFRNKKEFDAYLRNVRKIGSRNYMNEVVNTYRDNLKSAINKVFNSSGGPLIDFINTLSNSELRELSLNEDFKDIGFVYYEPIAVKQKLQVMKYQVAKIRARKNA